MNKMIESIPENTIMIQKIDDVFWLGGYHTVFDPYRNVEIQKFEPIRFLKDKTLTEDDILDKLIDFFKKINAEDI